MGVALNGVLRPGDLNKALHKLKILNDEKFSKIFTLLYSLTENLDLFGKYGVDSIFECKIVSVDPRARGKGLAGELVKRSIRVAKENGFEV
jgi:GNAT superfamily N-acetyltransferase